MAGSRALGQESQQLMHSATATLLATQPAFATGTKENAMTQAMKKQEQAQPPFTLPDLPYAKDAFGDLISAETFDYHHGKHHNAYVVNLNNLQKGTEFEALSLEEIVKKSSGGIYNNAAQIWNHTFFWYSMKKNGGGKPTGPLFAKIEQSFGSWDQFKTKFKDAGTGQFGSGWAWLVADGDELKIIKTSNAETPITNGVKPLLTCDVWEHAYYIDYRNRRADYIDIFLEHMVNWEFAEKNFFGK